MAFVEALHQGRAAPVTGEDGLAAMRLEAAVAESARTGRVVALPDGVNSVRSGQ
jgi:predicted dehydrogenase